MYDFMTNAKRWLWEFVELGFVLLLALLLVHMLLGSASGSYVASVADNVAKFATGASGGIIGIVLVLGIIYFLLQRGGWRTRI